MKKYLLFFVISLFVSKTFAQEKFDHREIAKTIFDLFQKKEFEKMVTYFDTAFVRRMPVPKLEQLKSNVATRYGNYLKTKDVRVEEHNGITSVIQIMEFEKSTVNCRVVFNKRNLAGNISFLLFKEVDMYKLPAYYDSTKVTEREVKLLSDKYILPGTLSIPKTAKKSPGVLLVHGSGPNDRDETVGATKIFKDIALGLATKGVAVLRFDKRAKIYSQKAKQVSNKYTVNDEIIDDVIVAYKSLKNNPAIDSTRIFLLGHGFGGMLLPRIAKQLPNVAGLFMVDAYSGKLEDFIYDEMCFLLKSDSMTAMRRTVLDTLKSQVAKIKNLGLGSADSSLKMFLGLPKSYWIDLNGYNQIEVAKNLSMPLYFLQGERDFQVPVKEFDSWKKELTQKKNVQFKLYPKLNHSFQEGDAPSVQADYDKQANVPVYVIDDLYNWVAVKKK